MVAIWENKGECIMRPSNEDTAVKPITLYASLKKYVLHGVLQ